MKHRVRRFSIHQTSKTSATLYGLFFLLVSAVGIVAALLGHEDRSSILVFVFLPLFYMIVTYIGTAMGCGIYNLVARWVGGIEVILEEEK